MSEMQMFEAAMPLGGKPQREGFVSRPYAGYGQPENVDHVPMAALDPIDALPDRVREKVRRLEFDHQESNGAMLAIASDVNFLRATARDLRDRAAELQYRLREEPSLSRNAEAAERAAAGAEDKLRAAQQRAEAAGQRREETGALLGSVRNFISDIQGLEIRSVDIPPLKKPPADLIGAVEEVRGRLRELEDEKGRVEASTLPSSEAKEQARAQLESLTSAIQLNVAGLIENRGGRISFSRGVSEPSGMAVAFWANKSAVLSRVDEAIDKFMQGRTDALSTDDRRAALEQLAGDRIALERTEEQLIVLALARGVQIARRGDASPLAVLGVELVGLKS